MYPVPYSFRTWLIGVLDGKRWLGKKLQWEELKLEARNMTRKWPSVISTPNYFEFKQILFILDHAWLASLIASYSTGRMFPGHLLRARYFTLAWHFLSSCIAGLSWKVKCLRLTRKMLVSPSCKVLHLLFTTPSFACWLLQPNLIHLFFSPCSIICSLYIPSW